MTRKLDEPALFQGQHSYNRTIYEDELLYVGLFRTRPSDDLFHTDGQAQNHLLVFPHTGVLITPEGREQLVADPTVVMLYNKHQQYRRAPLSEHGDACVYFSFAPQVLLEMVPDFDPEMANRPDYPFPQNASPSDPQSFLLHGLVTKHILGEETPDPLFIQETMLNVLGRIVANVTPAGNSRRRLPRAKTYASARATPSATAREHARLARDAQALLATRFYEPLSLQDIGAHLGVSAYHLCRVFRRHTGVTIHNYRNDLRLRVALEHVLGGETDLSSLALTLGFANHSHFTKAFRHLFEATPSQLRDTRLITDPKLIRQMSKILTV